MGQPDRARDEADQRGAERHSGIGHRLQALVSVHGPGHAGGTEQPPQAAEEVIARIALPRRLLREHLVRHAGEVEPFDQRCHAFLVEHLTATVEVADGEEAQ